MNEGIIGIDLGGTNLRGGLVNEKGEIIRKIHKSSSSFRNSDTLLKGLECLISELSQGFIIRGIGLGVPGGISFKEQRITQSPNLPYLENFALSQSLAHTLKLPVTMDNDANCAALGEKWKGKAHSADTFCLLTLGTGVGCGIVLNGRLWRGVNGTAGEAGHISINFDGPPCKCGSRGCLEVYCSGRAIERMASEALSQGVETSLSGMDSISAKAVEDAAFRGDELAISIMRKMGRYLGIGIANIANLLDLEMTLIGGKVAHSWDLFIEDTLEAFREGAFKAPTKGMIIDRASLGDDAGIIGAAYLALINTSSEG